MPFPSTRDALKEAGYVFCNHASCRDCDEEIEWYFTPRGRKIAMNLMPVGSSAVVVHHFTCTETD